MRRLFRSDDRRGTAASGLEILRSIPFLGPVRVAQIIAIVGTPFRFRGNRRFWPHIGLSVVTHSSADNEIVAGTIRRRRRPPLTRGLNRNHTVCSRTSSRARPPPPRTKTVL
jgi:transposase